VGGQTKGEVDILIELLRNFIGFVDQWLDFSCQLINLELVCLLTGEFSLLCHEVFLLLGYLTLMFRLLLFHSHAS